MDKDFNVLRTLMSYYETFRAEVRMFDTMLQVSAMLMVAALVTALITAINPWVPIAIAGFALAMFYRNFMSLLEKLQIVEKTGASIQKLLGETPPVFIHETKVVDLPERKAGDGLMYAAAGLCAIAAVIIAIVRLT
jgi:hypothetical protein